MAFVIQRIMISKYLTACLQLHITRLTHSKFLSSSSSNGRPVPVTDVTDYLVNRHQFTSEAASTISSFLKCLKNPERCDSTLPYLKSSGFSQPLLEKLLCRRPKLLTSMFETIKPKIELFLEMGFSPGDMAQIISSTPEILCVGVDRIRPSILQIDRVMGSRSSAIELLKLDGIFLRYDLENTLIRNIEVLKGRGVSEQQILHCIPRYRNFFLHKPERMEGIIDRVDEMKFSRSSKSYIHAIRALSSMSEKTWEGKLQFFQELGFSREDVLAMFRRAPQVCTVSENKLVESTRFLLNQHGVDLSVIARNPALLTYSVTNRLLPRFKIVNFLVGKKLLGKRPSAGTLCALSNHRFLRIFVLPYSGILEENKLPVILSS